MKVSRKRSLMKTFTFRILATIVTFLLVLVFTGSLILSIGIGLIDLVAKTLLYYGHERFWDGVKWGRR